MCCDQLVCAHCAHPVADARCSACRSTRAALHGSPLPAAVYVAAAAVLLAVMLLLSAHLR